MRQIKICVALLIIGCVTVSSGTAVADGENFDAGPYLHAQRLIDIGGRRLNLYCLGNGSLTVVLDAGLGGTTFDWYKVQKKISRQVRVCSYDRAGMGFSDGTASERDPLAVVRDLHALLRAAGFRPPYVLVGHSIAGLYEPLYADLYPTEVAGLVLVDPSRPYERSRFASVAPDYVKTADSYYERFFARCEPKVLHRSATVAELEDCGFSPAAVDRKACAREGAAQCAIDKVALAQAQNPLYWRDLKSEHVTGNSILGSDEVQHAQRFYGAMPLIVLTADDGSDHTLGYPPNHIPKAQFAAEWRVFKAMHDQLAKYSTLGVNLVIHHTSHNIQVDQPTAIISAIDSVVEQARRYEHGVRGH